MVPDIVRATEPTIYVSKGWMQLLNIRNWWVPFLYMYKNTPKQRDEVSNTFHIKEGGCFCRMIALRMSPKDYLVQDGTHATTLLIPC